MFLKLLNLSLLVAFPVAWMAPLLKAGLLPFFKLSEISVLSGLQSLWEKDIILAVAVTFFALVAPYLKTVGLALIHFNLASPKLLPPITLMGKLAMADIFLIALYIVIAKGVGIGRLETGWGLYAFTACVLVSLYCSFMTKPATAGDVAKPQKT
ncbi:paraquat-inducible protein A [uncultured Litoreibacter sp.]|uniref:paraquat-inducible protein A n=1 Tax=uncultured Litoreibacter sp. TaxID=1392394 RepID=UPI00262946DE|nr:paraquat-inducible protein A [uncultured Litoreibacter sp.]